MTLKTEQEMIRDFFSIVSDYQLCQTSARNVLAGITSYEKARELMWKKAEGARMNRVEIEERLNSKKILINQHWKILRTMSLNEIIHLPDEPFREALKFYLKHPYAHSRISQNKLMPRFFRTLFFRQLIGQAMLRKLDVDVQEMFELMRML